LDSQETAKNREPQRTQRHPAPYTPLHHCKFKIANRTSAPISSELVDLGNASETLYGDDGNGSIVVPQLTAAR
jgi:hypothetical protein